MVIIQKSRLVEGFMPIRVEELGARVDALCSEARSTLVKKWLPACSDLFAELVCAWSPLVPTKPGDSLALVEKLFSCVAALMSIQIRSLVMKSLRHFRDILTLYKVRFNKGAEDEFKKNAFRKEMLTKELTKTFCSSIFLSC